MAPAEIDNSAHRVEIEISSEIRTTITTIIDLISKTRTGKYLSKALVFAKTR
jgi:hypothetical protein